MRRHILLFCIISFAIRYGYATTHYQNRKQLRYRDSRRRQQSSCSAPEKGCGYGLWNESSCSCKCIPVSAGATCMSFSYNLSHFYDTIYIVTITVILFWWSISAMCHCKKFWFSFVHILCQHNILSHSFSLIHCNCAHLMSTNYNIHTHSFSLIFANG